MYYKYIQLYSFLLMFSLTFSCLEDKQVKKYYKVKSCRRSDLNILGRVSVSSLKECSEYAREKNALAFNFGPPEAMRKRKRQNVNCHALGCPELNNFTSLINDSFFDYYSSYGNATVLINATCLKSIGVFRLFHEKLNYTESIEQCQMIFGDLPHILTETRTISLSKLLTPLTDWYKAAYVGLDDIRTEGRYETPLGDPINCYKYRAWSPGHPRNKIRSDDCVILDSDRTWKIINCKNKMAFLCELHPMPPDKNKNKYLDVDCDDIDESGERDKCSEFQQTMRKRKKHRNRCIDDE